MGHVFDFGSHCNEKFYERFQIIKVYDFFIILDIYVYFNVQFALCMCTVALFKTV